MSEPTHEFLIDLDGLMWCGDECPAEDEHHRGTPPETIPDWEWTDEGLLLWSSGPGRTLWTHAEFDAIARKEGYVRLDVLLVAADADLVLNNARCDLVDPTIKRQWALARKRLRSVLAALDPEGDT